ncbi:MAG: hypothetical protein IJ646_00860 [Clostridia bacterium]|nr:hypothetical protein [Clostridia bacterium]
MTMRNAREIAVFRGIVEHARGEVWAQDGRGRRYDLKDALDLYRALGVMLDRPDNDLELFASDYNAQLQLERFFWEQRMGLAV